MPVLAELWITDAAYPLFPVGQINYFFLSGTLMKLYRVSRDTETTAVPERGNSGNVQ